ncbi:hypothetical protein [Marinobacter fonticola]|uniref:hypothetical protein n=1 Tax=Marinobacter fonticola TaxID=2603215 RepID=UPI0011E85658|nr:hypothetical protein [Marinobacter fonticola]
MANRYFVDKVPHPNGSHEVHVEGCSLLPESHECRLLGYHHRPETALRPAKTLFRRAHLCAYCAGEWQFNLIAQGEPLERRA